MGSKLRPILQAVKGGCRPNSPRAACQAADAVRFAGAKIRKDWPGMKVKATEAYEACRSVRFAGAKIRKDWPGVKVKMTEAYEAWKSAVNSGDEFMTLCHKTGRLIVFFGSPVVLLKIAYTEYSRSDATADASSRYEKTRATALAILHYADPPLAELYEFLSGDNKAGDDHSLMRRILKEVDEMYQDGLQDAPDHIWERQFKYMAGHAQEQKLLREEEAKKLKEEEEAKKLKEEAEKQEVEAASSGMMEWISSLFWGKDKDSAVSDKSLAGADAAGDNTAAIGGPHGGVVTSTGKGADPGSSGTEDKVRPPGGV